MMNKFVGIILCLTIVTVFAACGKNSAETTPAVTETVEVEATPEVTEEPVDTAVEEEASNEIIKTVTTTITNGEIKEDVVYTDGNGKVLNTEDVAETFESELNSIRENEPKTAAVTFVNKSGSNIQRLYLALSSDKSWGDNILAKGYTFINGDTTSSDNISVTYTPDLQFSLKIVTDLGGEYSFDKFTFGNLEDPENATITIGAKDGRFVLEVS